MLNSLGKAMHIHFPKVIPYERSTLPLIAANVTVWM